MRKRTCNNDVRFAVKRAGLHLWQVAESLELAPSTFSVMLRHELDAATKSTIFEAIKMLSREN